ncbi:P-loop containing nucleoside triphosphate hydrolase protein [Lactifluus volemus]|nr:P-loop containing nucleoside triphosphate hydrolase protein [Lactifluus volemus]
MAEDDNDQLDTFTDFSHLLSPLILRSLADLGFSRPTLVQRKAIPLALENRDVLARARTGSGKTAAYCIPIVQKLLNTKAEEPVVQDDSRRATRALILVPTRELAEQVIGHLRGLVKYCETDISSVNVAGGVTTQLQRILLSDKPDIVIGTPSKVLALLRAKALSLDRLESLVIDEADLILSYGHDEDIRSIFSESFLPKVYQSFLMSATMTEDVTLKLEEEEESGSNLVQYVVRTTEADKFLLTYIILKLKLIQGKCIMFVNDVDRCYRVKLFLEQFSIKSCLLPVQETVLRKHRYHVVQEFNKGVYDYIIATDEGGNNEDDEDSDDSGDDNQEEIFTSTQREAEADRAPGPSQPKRKRAPTPPPTIAKASPRKRRRGAKRDTEYGVARGIDFLDVACVLNFDLPTSSRAYTHRVGRTARAGRGGTALSFVLPSSEFGKHKAVGGVPSTRHDERYVFDKKQVDAFRYRMEDALRAVTRHAIREARLKEIKQELLTNPNDFEYLKHDKPLHPTRVQPHMKHVPKYLMPKIPTTGRGRGRGRGRGGKFSSGRGKGGKKNDPLKKFR